ncbi:hypothetical protein D3C86_2206980 [compost metagenome]
MRARRHTRRNLLGSKTSRDRKTITEALCRRKDIRRYCRVLIGEQVAGSTDARLHLVDDE